jgi:transposase-like protein
MAESHSLNCWPAYARVPPFIPVPLRTRGDGWTPERQARFIGLLAESGSVSEAARRLGISRMAAYRLRRCPGAESLAHAWDAVLAFRKGEPVKRRKVTAEELAEHAHDGPFHVLMRRGRFVRARRKPNVPALLRYLRRLDAAAARGGWDW